jgi:hypothetical protein
LVATSVLTAVVDVICVRVVVWPGDVDLEVDELDDAVRGEVTDAEIARRRTPRTTRTR